MTAKLTLDPIERSGIACRRRGEAERTLVANRSA
jgi:hypothetical protein